MVTKNEAKYIQSLYHKKTREAEGVFVVEGPKMVNELLASSYDVKHIYATAEWKYETEPRHAMLTVVSEDELQRLSGLQAANQVLAVARQRLTPKPRSFKGLLTLAVDNIQDPGNLGTIIRIADWFGVRNILASNDTVELYNPKVIQSTMGSFTRVDTWYGDLEEILGQADVPVYGALLQGEDIRQTGRVEEGIIVIGNESRGLTNGVKELVTKPVTIVRRGGAESLNAAVATGIILSHITG